MVQLSESEIEFITQSLKAGKPLPDSYRYVIPFETKKEYELTYADKEREEDILADTFAVPLQPVKTFGSNGDGWTNKLIFGDNLQVLKTLMNDPEIKGKVRLIYIDPPFGTGDIYDARSDAPAYSAKLQGAKFIEFLRKRLVFLKEILADDGSICVRTDYHFGHYLKAIMDEVFSKNNFKNEIVVKRTRTLKGESGRFHTATDSIFLYAFDGHLFHGFRKEKGNPRWVRMHLPGIVQASPERIFFGKKLKPPNGRKWVLSQEAVENAMSKGLIKWDEKLKEPVFLNKWETLGSNWTDIPGYSFRWNYPTENSEQLLERVILASSSPGDLVLDAFAGSGTTGDVAEKLGRRWIMIDCGKLAIYTMQKRLLNLRKEIGNKGKPLKAKPFTLYNAGLYDYQKLKQLPWEEYRDFVLKLFQCRDEKHRIAGVELDGYLGADDVLVFNYQKYKDAVLDRGFIDDLYSILGDKIGRRFFIIAPAASVIFLEDYIEKGSTRYFLLRIPYSIIDELHRKGFTHIKQPVSEMDVNNTVDAVGFDFIQAPDVECEYYLGEPKGQVGLGHSGRGAVIKIEKFESNIISKKPLHYENLETLSMIMVDYSYDGEVFNFADVFYAEDLKKQDYEIRFDSNKLDGQMMIIYIDIFGNEKREVKKLDDFRKR
ncbi:MAG: site-specific DNA-methyltransferase [Thermodesulfobacteriota bacterium]|nr:site-specific DNA-methyltransferase [Thermodesulfobacteriota bacterium]